MCTLNKDEKYDGMTTCTDGLFSKIWINQEKAEQFE